MKSASRAPIRSTLCVTCSYNKGKFTISVPAKPPEPESRPQSNKMVLKVGSLVKKAKSFKIVLKYEGFMR